MPPHELNLKIGAIFMLLSNLNAANGQCNGTRSIIRGADKLIFYFVFVLIVLILGLYPNLIDIGIIAGSNVGNRIFLSRINFTFF